LGRAVAVGDIGDTSHDCRTAPASRVPKFAAKAWYLALMFALAFAVLAAPLAGFPVNSRLGRIISRFARKKFPVPMPRELFDKVMIIRTIFRQFWSLKGEFGAIPGYFPDLREFRPGDPGLKSSRCGGAAGCVAQIGPGVFPCPAWRAEACSGTEKEG
jgi:hypothetical protein